jgi:hypothetical protein
LIRFGSASPLIFLIFKVLLFFKNKKAVQNHTDQFDLFPNCGALCTTLKSSIWLGPHAAKTVRQMQAALCSVHKAIISHLQDLSICGNLIFVFPECATLPSPFASLIRTRSSKPERPQTLSQRMMLDLHAQRCVQIKIDHII